MKLINEQDAINQAMDAGYRGFTGVNEANVLQDPAFWQALGKARGWEDARGKRIADWLYYALRYFEIVLSGGNIKAFWQSLP